MRAVFDAYKLAVSVKYALDLQSFSPIVLPTNIVSFFIFFKHSNENEFDLHENGPVGATHFHTNGFARKLVLKQRQRVTRK